MWEEILESTKPYKVFQMSRIENFQGDGGEELIKIKTQGSNNQRFQLKVYNWAQELTFKN